MKEEMENPKNLWDIATKYHSGHEKHSYELIDEPEKNVIKLLLRKS